MRAFYGSGDYLKGTTVNPPWEWWKDGDHLSFIIQKKSIILSPTGLSRFGKGHYVVFFSFLKT